MTKKIKGWICKGRGGIVEIWNTKYSPVKCFDNGRREWYWVASSKEGEGLDGWRWPLQFEDDIYPSISCDDKPKPIEISITIKEKRHKKTVTL